MHGGYISLYNLCIHNYVASNDYSFIHSAAKPVCENRFIILAPFTGGSWLSVSTAYAQGRGNIQERGCTVVSDNLATQSESANKLRLE